MTMDAREQFPVDMVEQMLKFKLFYSILFYSILFYSVVCRAIMTMDAREQFPVDMVEQMLKFTPSPEERALLDEHAEEIDHLARADRFLFELSK